MYTSGESEGRMVANQRTNTPNDIGGTNNADAGIYPPNPCTRVYNNSGTRTLN